MTTSGKWYAESKEWQPSAPAFNVGQSYTFDPPISFGRGDISENWFEGGDYISRVVRADGSVAATYIAKAGETVARLVEPS